MELVELGFTQEELQERVIDKICHDLLYSKNFDEEGDCWYDGSRLRKELDERIQKAIDNAFERLADDKVLPYVSTLIENIVLQKTNEWGERKGDPVTFVEYLMHRAEAYLSEKVNYDGKSKSEARDSYSWSGTQTRIAHMVDRHLHFSIEQFAKKALADANQSLAAGIAETCKQKLTEVAASLKVSVQTK